MLLLAAVGTFTAFSPAGAAVYTVAFDGANFKLLANITTNAADLITDLNGSVLNKGNQVTTALTGVLPLGTQSLWTFDNLFSAGSNPLSFDGIVLTSANPNFLYNLFASGGNTFLSTTDPDGSFYANVDLGVLTVGAIPEPATWAMMLVGFFGIAVVATRRRVVGSAF